MGKKGSGLGAMLVLALIIVALSVALALAIVRSSTEPPPPVREGIQRLNQLATVRTTDFVFVEKEDSSRLPGFLSGETVRLVAVGEVEAGVDLANIKGKDVEVNEKTRTVTIDLPQPEILDVSLDEEQTRVYDQDMGLWRRIAPNPDLAEETRD